MKILFITNQFPPFTTAESLCNGKLVLALKAGGHDVDVISRNPPVETYCSEWVEPWLSLKENVHIAAFDFGNKFQRAWDAVYSTLVMRTCRMPHIRWARRALKLALEMHREKKYDAVMTRSLPDVSHLVGLYFVRESRIPWFANWNDPTFTTFPFPYKMDVTWWMEGRFNRIVSKCMAAATCHTFPSQELMDHLKGRYPVLQKVPCRVIPHTCLPDTCYTPTGKYEGNGTVFRMCHSGQLTQERDPDLLLQAMKEVMAATGTDIRLDVAGLRDPYIDEVIERNGMQDHVCFKGTFPYAQALDMMGRYDVLLLVEAHLENGIFFASKLTDYVRAGRPIFALSPAKGFAVRTFQAHGGAEVADNESLDSITAGLTKLVQAWKNGTLGSLYSTAELRNLWSAESVLAAHNAMFREMIH